MTPLAGLVVVSLEQAVAAPFCSMRLADAGATVIKIERPEGDFARGYDQAAGGESSYFVWLNRGKQSLVLDLSQQDARQTLATMLSRADVFIQNLKRGAVRRLGFDIPDLRQRHPGLICCSISGYGDSGPLADRKAYDLLVQAEAGLASVTGNPEGPARVGISVVDISTGATAYSSILEALRHRDQTGEGADIRLAMFDVLAEWMAVPLLNAEAGTPPQRLGLRHPSIAPYGVFKTADGPDVLLSVQSEREWGWLCDKVLQAPWAKTDPALATNVDRVRNRARTDALVQDACGQLSATELGARLTDANIAFAMVNDMAALSAHPHLRRTMVELSSGLHVPVPAVAAIINGQTRSLGPVPGLGHHRQLPGEAAAEISQKDLETDLNRVADCIGAEQDFTEAITPQLVERFCQTVGWAVQAEDLVSGAPAPLGLLWCLGQPNPQTEALGPDGHALHGLYPVPNHLTRRMWASGTLRFVDALLVGDAVRHTARVADVNLKQGGQGPLLFVHVDHRYQTSRGLAIEEEQVIVYRPPPASSQPLARMTPARATATHTTPAQLFRYSALTWNSHRIHYDLDHCRQVERYPDLVVHGPLQATWLMGAAASALGSLQRFTFRGRQPLFCGEPFDVVAAEGAFAVQRSGGDVTMTATASA